MRDILYRKKQSLKNRRKMISISEHSDDRECRTYVRKNFVYIVTRVQELEKPISQPEIYIKKSFDSKLRQESFSFRVKGFFFITRGMHILRVDFCHTLKINIAWKDKIFSPNKSATLT